MLIVQKMSFLSPTLTFNIILGDYAHGNLHMETRTTRLILITRRWKSSIRDSNMYPSFDCGGDHKALVAEVCLKLHRDRRQLPKLNQWNVGNNTTFKGKIEKALENITRERVGC